MVACIELLVGWLVAVTATPATGQSRVIIQYLAIILFSAAAEHDVVIAILPHPLVRPKNSVVITIRTDNDITVQPFGRPEPCTPGISPEKPLHHEVGEVDGSAWTNTIGSIEIPAAILSAAVETL